MQFKLFSGIAHRMKKIAALFVATDGPYVNHSDIDAWTEERDARKYQGPNPIIAHPPCQRWGNYWFGGPSCRVRKKLGDDDGCFISALKNVRRYGGVIEHPAKSRAWGFFNLQKPPIEGGWVKADEFGGWTCHVEQGHYGHLARKATWLYVNYGPYPSMISNLPALPNLIWGPSEGKMKIEESFPTNEARWQARADGFKPIKRLTVKQRTNTPIEFMNLLIKIIETISNL